MSASIQEIRDVVLDQAKKGSSVLGSNLGYALRKKLPELDLKSKYGSLRQFIERHCGDEIVWVGKRGADNVYARVGANSLDNNTSESSAGETLWKAFSNPIVELHVILNRNTGDVSVTSSATVPSGEYLPLQKVSKDEYRLMCEQFLPRVSDLEIEAQLKNALAQNDFWPAWSNVVNRYRYKGVFSEWLDFRREHILEILKSRLKALNLSEPANERILNSFRQKRHLTSAAPLRRNEVLKPDRRPRAGIRRVIGDAITSLSDEDLRRIWLPAGVLIDALRRDRER
jgi:hypothetical protein